MTTVFDQLESGTPARNQAVAGLHDVARRIAADDDPEASAVEQLLGDAGWNADQLRGLVNQYIQRGNLQRQLREATALEAEREEIQERITAAESEFQAARRKYQATVPPLNARRQQIGITLGNLKSAADKLVKSCPDAELNQQLASNQRELKATIDQRTAMIHTVQECDRVTSNAATEFKSSNPPPGRRAMLIEEHQKASDRKTDAQQQMPTLTARIEELQAEEQQIREQMAAA